MKVVSAPNVNENYDDTVTITNLSVEGYQPRKPYICRTFVGSTREEALTTSKPLNEQWDTKNCKVSSTDITSF
jgi:hypothetical protein